MNNDVKKINGLTQLKIGDILVEMSYPKEGKEFNECILNLLKVKMTK